jgi:hypothetical protein
VVSFTPRLLYTQEKNPCYQLDRRLGGPQSRSGRGGEEKNSQLLPGLELSIIQPIAQRYTTELPRLASVCTHVIFKILMNSILWNLVAIMLPKIRYRTVKIYVRISKYSRSGDKRSIRSTANFPACNITSQTRDRSKYVYRLIGYPATMYHSQRIS